MKYAITGHTKGIGEGLYNTLDNTRGFSTSSGYDISNPAHRNAIVEQSQDCDVFINNAYCGDGQTYLLYELYEQWKDQDKIIVNISSNTTDGIKQQPHPYSAHKAGLEKASEQLANLPGPCKVITVRFGYVATERIKSLSSERHHDQMISVSDAVEYILQTIRWSDKYLVPTTTLLPRINE